MQGSEWMMSGNWNKTVSKTQQHHTEDKPGTVADPEGGFRGFKPEGGLAFFVFFPYQYMKIPTDLDPKPPLRRILAQNPPPPS